jgi:hypothetical protein
MVFPVEVMATLVQRTHTIITSVQIAYDPVSVRMRPHIEPFFKMAEAMVVPSARFQRSREMVVSPSSRMMDSSAKTIVRVQPGSVRRISQDISVSPVQVVP